MSPTGPRLRKEEKDRKTLGILGLRYPMTICPAADDESLAAAAGAPRAPAAPHASDEPRGEPLTGERRAGVSLRRIREEGAIRRAERERQLAEEEERARQWQEVRAVVQRTAIREGWDLYGWDRAIHAGCPELYEVPRQPAAPPASAELMPPNGQIDAEPRGAVAKSWRRAIHAGCPELFAEPRQPDAPPASASPMAPEEEGAGRSRGAVAEGWDRALASFAAAASPRSPQAGRDGRATEEAPRQDFGRGSRLAAGAPKAAENESAMSRLWRRLFGVTEDR